MKQSFDIHWLTRRRSQVPDNNDWLTPDERAVLAGLRVLKRRSDWRLGRWAAKCLLRARLDRRFRIRCHGDIEVRAAADGGPVVLIHGQPAPITLSISHSNGVGLCALVERETSMGCDTELIEPRTAAFVSDFFSGQERDLVGRVRAEDKPFVETLIWSAKESVLKALRVGLRRDTRSVVVDVGDRVARRGAAWQPFAARCTDDGDVFSGLWMSAAGHVHTVATGTARGCQAA
jgi:4'-phosphopantetheinyl transferase